MFELNMIRGENSDSIPIDLIIEILARLTAKSIARCRCVSKLWSSMLLCPYFTELFLTRSLARPPRLLFAVKRRDDCWCFFTSPQPQKPLSSLVVVADSQMKFPGECIYLCGIAFGLIYFRGTMDTYTVICNPSTGQYGTLPLPLLKGRRMRRRTFLGFDPTNKQFKVLSIANGLDDEKEAVQILKLGIEKDSWRKIHCPLKHFPSTYGEGVCINGVLYYFTEEIQNRMLIVCFDVRSEKFKFIYRDFICNQHSIRVINYKGKLGVITLNIGRRSSLELSMWVIEDDEKPQWSNCFSYRWDKEVIVGYSLSIVGITATGEIVLSMNDASTPFYVFFFNLERKTLQSVEIQGFGSTHIDYRSRVEVFVDHVEDLKFVTI